MIGQRYIAVTGPIGVGKSTLAQRLAEHWSCPLLREQYDHNPFLADFYRQGRSVALPTELYFVHSRFEQLRTVPPPGPGARGPIVSDFIFAKGLLFATLTLSPEEQRIFRRLYDPLAGRVRQPDAIIYLTDTTERLVERIRQRGRPMEQSVDAGYVESLRVEYEDYFARTDHRVLHIDAARQDLLDDDLFAAIDAFAAE